MVRLKLVSFSSLVCLVLVPVLAPADDFAPPPWSRSDPYAVTAEWEFLTPANPSPPDGALTNVLTKGSHSVATIAEIVGPAGWGGDSGGNWFFPPSTEPQGIRFTIDNIVDTRPVKNIQVQVTHSPGVGLFIDPLPSLNTSTPTPPVIISGSDATHSLFVWSMFPNPPWETFFLHVTTPGEIREVVVDTISTVPEPSMFVWCGLALATVGLVCRIWPQLLKQLIA